MAGLVVGTEAFAQRLRRQIRGNAWEQAQLKRLSRPVPWERIVASLDQAKDESWEQFSDRHGDWGRDAALWLGRRQGRLGLAELGRLASGMDYAAVGQAVSRFGKRLAKEASLQRELRRMESQMSNVAI